MSEKNNGGPAFPALESSYVDRDDQTRYETSGGMTVRDYFAAKALAALINHPRKDGINCGGSAVPTLAQFAYEYADAMLAERAK